MLVDPLGFRFYSWSAQNAVGTLHVPFSLSSALLVTLYWHESLQLYSLKINPFLRKMFWPFIVIVGLAIVLEAAAIVVRIVVKNLFGTAYIIVYSYYMFILAGVIIFYSLTAARILAYMRKSEKMGKIWQRRKKVSELLTTSIGVILTSPVGYGVDDRWWQWSRAVIAWHSRLNSCVWLGNQLARFNVIYCCWFRRLFCSTAHSNPRGR